MNIGLIGTAVALATATTLGQPRTSRTPIPYEDAAAAVEGLPPSALPAALRTLSPQARRLEWPGWARERDLEIRARLARGDEDSIVNLLLYGLSYTKEPRLTEREVALGLGARQDVMARRIDDLVRGAIRTSSNERLVFVSEVMTRAGIDASTAAGQREGRRFVGALLDRYVRELRGFVQASASHAQNTTVFSDRGLSSDTSIHPGFAVEQALKALSAAGMMNGVRRVAIVGPGLDFADKREGLDAYPEQTIQPFGLVDSLLRLHLATAATLHVTTFDLSPRVNHHLEVARERARRGEGYRVELPRRADIQWTSELVNYWERFGDQIGEPVLPTRLPSLGREVTSRAVRIRPAILLAITARDLNIVLEQADTSPEEGPFDLVVATNTLIYYDQFEQSLALTNIARMLRTGGWFFANDASLTLTSIPLTPIGWTALSYSDQVNSHERLSWYQRR